MKTKQKENTATIGTKQTALDIIAETMYNSMQRKIKSLMRKYRVIICKEEFVQLVSYMYAYDNTELTSKNILIFLEAATRIAKNDGMKKLCQNSIVKIFEEEIKIFKEEQKNSLNYLEQIAYHEIGHFVINEELKLFFRKTLYITIIGKEGEYAGANIYTPMLNQEKTLNGIEEVKKEVAMLLAGDIACEIFLGKRNEGIISDLEVATKVIHSMLLGTRVIRNGKYFGKTSYLIDGEIDYSYLSDKQKEELTKYTNKIMYEAEKMAKKILKKKKKQVEILVEALVERGVLTGHQARLLYYGVLELWELPAAKIKLIK